MLERARVRISLRHVSKRFGSLSVLDDISMDFSGGELVAVLGVNGAGKTTLLNLLSGIAGCNQGQIEMDGQPLLRADRAQRVKTGILLDFPPLFEGRSVMQNVATWLRLWDCDDDEHTRKATDLLERFDMLEHVKANVTNLSRGQRYKTALVGLAAVNPALWILDEPFASGMDQRGLGHFQEVAKAAVASGALVIYTTQMAELAVEFASRICVVADKKILYDEAPDQLLQRAGEKTMSDLFIQKLHSAQS